MPTVSITLLTVRKSGRTTKPPTYLGDESSPTKVKDTVPTPLLMSKKSVHDKEVDSVDDEIKSVDQTTPIN